jgi:DNA-binding CsgD family transcriptional regulator
VDEGWRQGLIIGGVSSRASSPVLVGRAAELGQLQAAFRLADDGQSSAVLIAGEAGVGKTRLVASFAAAAEADGASVLLGGCLDLGEGAVPYAPIVEALRGLIRRTDPDELEAVIGHGRSELARLMPDLGPVEEERASGLRLGSAQGRLFELLLGVLERMAARSPVVFVVEDLHWSDRSTRDLLGFLIRNLRDARVMLLLTYRSDELHRRHPLLPFVAELGRLGQVDRVDLRPFDGGEVTAQLEAIAGRTLETSLIESIHARSGGNAFFAEELLMAADEDGRAELPATLRDVLLGRVAHLAERTQEFLRVASAAGQRVEPGLVAAASGMDEAAVYDALRECVNRQVLVPDPTSGDERYAFRHALLQEAVYEDLLPGERTRLHSAFALVLERTSAGGASRAAELAYHWYAAHDLPRALESAVAAADAAEQRYAFPEAAEQYERAVELWDQVADAERLAGRDRVELLAALANVAGYQDPARAVAYIQTAISQVDPTVDPARSGRLHERLGRHAWIAGQGDLAKQGYQQAVLVTPAEPPSEARARAMAGFAQILMLGGRYAESLAMAEDALGLARSVGARGIEGHARNTRGLGRGVAGDVDGGLEDLEVALRIAEEVDNVDDIGRAFANTTWMLELAGRLEDAVAVAERGVAATAQLGLMRFFGTHLLCNVASCLYRLGRWDEAEAAVRRADAAGPIGINAILVEELLARFALVRGRYEEATRRLQPLAAAAERAVDIQFVGPVQASLAELALWQGQPREAAARVAATLRVIDHSPEIRVSEIYALGLRANADAAELARARRSSAQEAEAIAAGEALLDGMRRRHADVTATRQAVVHLSEVWLRLCEAEWARLHRRPDPVVWATCAEAWDRIGQPYTAGYAHWREAEARLATRGNREPAAAALRSALAIAQRLGAQPLEREVLALARRARLSLVSDGPDGAVDLVAVPSDPAETYGLTAREREVLALLALGRTNRQIADELFISGNTAGVHVSNILGKLGVGGRGEAAALAYRLGLVAPGPDHGAAG